MYRKTLLANTVLTWSNEADGQTILVVLSNFTGGALTCDFPVSANHKWPGGVSTVTVEPFSESVVTIFKAGAGIYANAINEML